jgi:hypothetical protein
VLRQVGTLSVDLKELCKKTATRENIAGQWVLKCRYLVGWDFGLGDCRFLLNRLRTHGDGRRLAIENSLWSDILGLNPTASFWIHDQEIFTDHEE